MVIGLGIDIVGLDDLRRSLDERGPAWVESIFTDGERATCLARQDAAPGLAARLAAKTAALSALGLPPGERLRDVEVLRESSGRPDLALHGEARAAADRLGVATCHVSLTHAQGHALALVVLEAR